MKSIDWRHIITYLHSCITKFCDWLVGFSPFTGINIKDDLASFGARIDVQTHVYDEENQMEQIESDMFSWRSAHSNWLWINLTQK